MFENWIRFSYDPKSGILRAWNAFFASHNDVINWEPRSGRLNGSLNIKTRCAGLPKDISFEELPDKLQKFLNGLDYFPKWRSGM